MNLSDQNIQEFQRIHSNLFGAEISKEDAHTQGLALLTLLLTIYKPMSHSEFNAIQKHRQNTFDQLFK